MEVELAVRGSTTTTAIAELETIVPAAFEADFVFLTRGVFVKQSRRTTLWREAAAAAALGNVFAI